MMSKPTLALIIALPLGLLLFAIIIGSAILLVRFWMQRVAVSEDLRIAKIRLTKLQKQVYTVPNLGSNELNDVYKLADTRETVGFLQSEVVDAYTHFFCSLGTYIWNWIDLEGPSAPPKKDSVSRIEAILFPKSPPSESLQTENDTSLFPNPHEYTAEEICSAIETRKTRHAMLQYILISVILKAAFLHENATSTLLPFDPIDVRSLYRLREAARTLDLSPSVLVHIASYWINNSIRIPNTAPRSTRRELYHTLIESLFEPYFDTNADRQQHRSDLNDILDKAAEFGKRATGCSRYFELRWGNREDVKWIVRYPALHVEYMDVDKIVNHRVVNGAMHSATVDEIRQDMIRAGAILDSA